MKTTVAIFFVLAMLSIWSTRVSAQDGVYVRPSLTFTQQSDSNVFSAPILRAAQPDVVRRTSPGVRAGFESLLWRATGAYVFDAEQYERHPALDDVLARQQGDIALAYNGRVNTATLAGSYLTTHSPQELNLLTGLNLQRAQATRFSAAPSIGHRFGVLTRGSMTFEFARSAFARPSTTTATAPAIVTHDMTAGLDRRLSPTDSGRVEYEQRGFSFGGAPMRFLGTGASHAVLLGWTHDHSRFTQFTLRAGPRLSGGTVQPEVAFEISRRRRSGDSIGIDFARTEGAALGEAGTTEIARLRGSATAHPVRRLALRIAPGLSRNTSRTLRLTATAYVVDATATSTLTRWFSLEAAYQGAWEHGVVPASGPVNFERLIFTIRAIVSVPGSLKSSRAGRRSE